MTHPVPYTPSLIEALGVRLVPLHVPEGVAVHDPFAGDGHRLAEMCDAIGRVYTGTDIEVWPESDERVRLGDSTDPATYPEHAHAIVTSPSYNNGVNDHFLPRETSRRLTYRTALGRALHDNNTGRWSGRSSARAEAEYWRISEEVVRCWPPIALVNVKDSIRAGEVYPLVRLWERLLRRHGYRTSTTMVATPSFRLGRNGEKRAESEAIIIAKAKAKR